MRDSRRLLLVSPDGMLGRAFAQVLTERGADFRGIAYPEIDLTSHKSIARALAGEFQVVVNCAGWTDVDGAEEHEAAAERVNATGVGALANRCRELGALLVQFSTDYVFDGRGSEPYPVDHPRCPINAYGRTKARGEELIAASGCEALVIRTSWLYAPWGKNFVRTIASLARQRGELRVIDDQSARPTSAIHLAATSLELVDAGCQGIYHVADGGVATWYSLAAEVVARVGSSCRVRPCATGDYPLPARRPAYSVLDLSNTQEKLSRLMPSWQQHLAEVLAHGVSIPPRTGGKVHA